MSEFLGNAERILDAASAAVYAGHTPSGMTILIDRGGAIHVLADSDWPLESLCSHHGALLAYRVSESRGKVRVEGRSGPQACLLETESPSSVARRLLQAHRRDFLTI